MKRIKREIALFLTLCLVFTGTIPAYAEEPNIPEKSAEAAEMLTEAGVSGVAVEETAAAEAAEAVEAELTENEVSSEPPAESAEKAEQAAMLGDDGVTKKTVMYIDENGTPQEKNCIIITSADGYSFEENEWYAVIADATINTRIENNAPGNKPARLILTDGTELTVKGGIHISGGKGLVIYGQSGGSGALNVTDVNVNNAGIGGDQDGSVGSVTIYGGTVTSGGICAGGKRVIFNCKSMGK